MIGWVPNRRRRAINFEVAGLAGSRNVASMPASVFPASPIPINRGPPPFIFTERAEDYWLPRRSESCRATKSERSFEDTQSTSEKVKVYFFSMSSVSDSENAGLSGSVDVTGDWDAESSTSTSTNSPGSAPGDQAGVTSGWSGIPRPLREFYAMPVRVVRPEEIEQDAPPGQEAGIDRDAQAEGGAPARGAEPEQSAPVNREEEAAERSGGEVSTSGSEESEASVGAASPPPTGESFEERRKSTRPQRVNGQRVRKMSDAEMERLAGDKPVYTMDYFTTGVTENYLSALRTEFNIPESVTLVVPGPGDLPSRPPRGHITLSAEFLRAGLRLPFHPFLRRALTAFNLAPIQLNANAYRILVGCYILWKKVFGVEMPVEVFQNIYRMKSSPSSIGSFYFQGHPGTFITGCPDSDKQFKHLWFYAGGNWIHRRWTRRGLSEEERVPVSFRRGYAWPKGPHIDEEDRRRIDHLRELADPERNHQRLLSNESLAENGWVPSTSTRPPGSIRRVPARVTVASRMPDPAVHYRARTVVTSAGGASTSRSEIPQGVPVASACGPSSGGSPSGDWGPRIADEDMDGVIRELYPERSLRIEGCFN